MIAYILIIILSAVSLAQSATFDVNSSAAFGTAITNANPGDTIRILNGTYTNWGLHVIPQAKDATPSQRITIVAQTEGNVIFSGNNALELDIRAANWTVSKLRWTGQTDFGAYGDDAPVHTDNLIVLDGAQNVFIDDVTINNVSGDGVLISVIRLNGSRANTGNVIQNNLFDTWTQTSAAVGIYIYRNASRGTNGDISILNNTFSNRAGPPDSPDAHWIKVGNSNASNTGDSNILIQGNQCINDQTTRGGQNSINVRGSNVELIGNTFNHCQDVIFRSGSNSTIARNQWINPATRQDRSIALYGAGHVFINNSLWTSVASTKGLHLGQGNTDVNGDTFLDFTAATGAIIAHNTFHGFTTAAIDMARASSGSLDGPTTVLPSTLVFQNNAVVQAAGTMFLGTCGAAFSTISHNARNGAAAAGCMSSGTNNVTAAPQFTNAGTGDLSLVVTSPLKDAGTGVAGTTLDTVDITNNARDASPDIGAYEFGAGAPPLTGTRYVDSSCVTQGNGTTTTCGATGPWTSLAHALTVADCAGMSPNDTLVVQGNASVPDAGNWYSEVFYQPVAVAPDSPCNGIIVVNESAEHVVLDGTVDIKGATWTSIGSGVYEATAGTTGTASTFPFRAWYKRGANPEEELDLIQSVQTCTNTLAAGKMRYNPTTNRVCVRLSDDSSPSATAYFRIPMHDSAFNMSGVNTDGIVYRSNPNGTGSFNILRYKDNGIILGPSVNQNITVFQLTMSHFMDAAIKLVGTAGNASYNLSGNTISYVGHGAINWVGDTGPSAFVSGNTISHLGESPMFEKCDGVGVGCLPGNGSGNDSYGIRVTNCAPVDGVLRGVISGNLISGLGQGRRGRSMGINLQNCSYHNIVDSNFIHTGSGTIGAYGILLNGIPAGQYHHENLIMNNRMENLTHGLTLDYTTATSQAGRVNRVYNNSCHNASVFCYSQEDGSGVGGQLLFRNNIGSATTAYAKLINVPVSPMWNASFTHNAFDCHHPNCSGSSVATIQGINYMSDADCTVGVNCIDGIGNGNIYTNVDLEDGTLNLVVETEELGEDGENEDFVPKNSQAIDAGVCLLDVPFDWAGTPRPSGPTCDIGAHEFIGETVTGALIQLGYRFYGRMESGTSRPLAALNVSPTLHDHSEFNLRIAVAGDSDVTAFTPELTLYYRRCQSSCGTWTPISTNCAASLCLKDNPLRADSSQIGNAIPLDGRTFSSESAFYDELTEGQNYQMAANVQLETEWSLKIGSLSGEGDRVEYQLRFLDGSELSRYDVLPSSPIGEIRATINASAP